MAWCARRRRPRVGHAARSVHAGTDHRRRYRSYEATQPCCPVVRENEYFQSFRYKNHFDAFGLRVSLLAVSHRFFYNDQCAQKSDPSKQYSMWYYTAEDCGWRCAGRVLELTFIAGQTTSNSLSGRKSISSPLYRACRHCSSWAGARQAIAEYSPPSSRSTDAQTR